MGKAVGAKSILTGRDTITVGSSKEGPVPGCQLGKENRGEAPKKTPWGTVTFVVVDWTLLQREHLEGDRRRGHQEMNGWPWRCPSMDGWRPWSLVRTSAKARKEVKLGMKLKVWREPSAAFFSPFCGRAWHAPSRG